MYGVGRCVFVLRPPGALPPLIHTAPARHPLQQLKQEALLGVLKVRQLNPIQQEWFYKKKKKKSQTNANNASGSTEQTAVLGVYFAGYVTRRPSSLFIRSVPLAGVTLAR